MGTTTLPTPPAAPAPGAAAADERWVLGLDGGGSGTRWCLMRLDGEVLAQGLGPVLPSLAPLSDAVQAAAAPLAKTRSGAQSTVPSKADSVPDSVPDSVSESAVDTAAHASHSPRAPNPARADTLAALEAALAQIALALPQRPHAVLAGLTGFDPQAMPALRPRLAAAFGVPERQAVAVSDIELLCRMAFAPGEGILVYAGTGSIAAHLRADGNLQRAGGRGALIDDAGSGHWIAAQALRRVWRMEDEAPGSSEQWPLAQALFSRIGGSDWASTRHWVAQATRGQVGQLALQVAAAAQSDELALEVLSEAGRELARLALALLQREGEQRVALAGRVFALHPEVQRALTVELPLGLHVESLSEAPHHGAARLARERIVRKGWSGESGLRSKSGNSALSEPGGHSEHGEPGGQSRPAAMATTPTPTSALQRANT
jgi:glucosamine kinase